jgi:hypothetical protein
MKITKEYLRRIIKEEISRYGEELDLTNDIVIDKAAGATGVFKVPAGKYTVLPGDMEGRVRLVTRDTHSQMANEFDERWLEQQKQAGIFKAPTRPKPMRYS